MRGEPLTSMTQKCSCAAAGALAKKAISVQEVVKTIANFYGVEEGSIYEKTRRKEVVRPRQVIMFLLREDFHIHFLRLARNWRSRPHHCYTLVRQNKK
jgi:chromosomal replication initiation ATPase DnaA